MAHTCLVPVALHELLGWVPWLAAVVVHSSRCWVILVVCTYHTVEVVASAACTVWLGTQADADCDMTCILQVKSVESVERRLGSECVVPVSFAVGVVAWTVAGLVPCVVVVLVLVAEVRIAVYLCRSSHSQCLIRL